MQNNIFENCIKNCSSERCKTGKLVLECGNEILNTTATSLNDKIVTFKQTNKKIAILTRFHYQLHACFH